MRPCRRFPGSCARHGGRSGRPDPSHKAGWSRCAWLVMCALAGSRRRFRRNRRGAGPSRSRHVRGRRGPSRCGRRRRRVPRCRRRSARPRAGHAWPPVVSDRTRSGSGAAQCVPVPAMMPAGGYREGHDCASVDTKLRDIAGAVTVGTPAEAVVVPVVVTEGFAALGCDTAMQKIWMSRDLSSRSADTRGRRVGGRSSWLTSCRSVEVADCRRHMSSQSRLVRRRAEIVSPRARASRAVHGRSHRQSSMFPVVGWLRGNG